MSKLFTNKELNIIGHSLGVDVVRAKKSNRKKDKKLPPEFYRNYFYTNESHNSYKILGALEANGYMERWIQDNDIYFGVTTKGQDKFRVDFERVIK